MTNRNHLDELSEMAAAEVERRGCWTIYKYPLKIDDLVELEIPYKAVPLCVQMQNGVPCLWALVKPSLPKTTYQFTWVGTGHPMDVDPRKYIGTVQMQDLVFHLFQIS